MSTTSRFTQWYSNFEPRYIPGCTLWLDAADSRTITLSGSDVTQWNDKSTSANNATGTAGSYPTYTDTQNSKNVITFNGSTQYLSFSNPSTLPTGTIDFSVFMVAKTNDINSATSQYFICWRTAASAQGYSVNIRTGFQRLYQEYNGGSVSYDTTYTTNSYFVFSHLSSTSANNPYINGTLFTFASTGAYNIGISDAALVGARTLNPSLLSPLKGTIGEILIYKRLLTTSERQQLEGYLGWKWGLYTNLPGGHPYISRNPNLSTFSPTDISNCGLWLDGADLAKITLSGSSVTQWSDKSGNNTHATVPTGASNPTYTTTLNGFGVVSFQGTNDVLKANNNFTDTSLMLFMVVRISNTQTTATYGGVLVTDTATLFGRSIGINPGTTNWQQEYRNGFTDLGSYTANTWYFVSLQFFGTSSAQFHVNGVLTGSPNASGASVNSDGLKLGSYNISGTPPNEYSTFQTNFDAAEVVVYASSDPAVITDTQRQRIEGYFAWKWGLTSSLPSTHPFKNFPPLKVN